MDHNQGIGELTVIFTEPVFDVSSAGSQLTPSSFYVTQTGIGSAPYVSAVAVDDADATVVRITLSRLISPRHWTTVIAHVEDACGNVIPDSGNLGPGRNEPDRIDVAALPGDIDQNGKVNPLDLIRFKRITLGTHELEWLAPTHFVDIDRNGLINPLDLIAFKRVIYGLSRCPEWCGWAGVGMPFPQP